MSLGTDCADKPDNNNDSDVFFLFSMGLDWEFIVKVIMLTAFVSISLEFLQSTTKPYTHTEIAHRKNLDDVRKSEKIRKSMQ